MATSDMSPAKRRDPASPAGALPRALPGLVLGAALLATLPGLGQLLGGLGSSLAPAGGQAASLGALLLTGLVGRVLLALLPAGHPGEHGLGGSSGGLAVTWAASHLLGVVVLPVQAALYGWLELPPNVLSLALPWMLPAAVRLATLPGDLVPRHGLTAPRAQGGAARAARQLLLGLTVLAALAPALAHLVVGSPTVPGGQLVPGTLGAPVLALPSLAADPLVGLACWPALVLLVHHALVALGLGPVLRLAACLLLVATPTALAAALASGSALGRPSLGPGMAELAPALPRAQLALGGATALGVVALVRADRRAALLALLGFLALSWLAPVTLPAAGAALSAAGLVTLLLASPGGLRARLAKPLVGALFLALLLGLLLMRPDHPGAPSDAGRDPLGSLRALLRGYDLWTFGLVLAFVDAAWLVALGQRAWRERSRPRRRPRPALLFLFVLAALTLLLVLAGELLLELAHPWLAARFTLAVPELLLLFLPGGVLLLASVVHELGPGAREAGSEHSATPGGAGGPVPGGSSGGSSTPGGAGGAGDSRDASTGEELRSAASAPGSPGLDRPAPEVS